MNTKTKNQASGEALGATEDTKRKRWPDNADWTAKDDLRALKAFEDLLQAIPGPRRRRMRQHFADVLDEQNAAEVRG